MKDKPDNSIGFLLHDVARLMRWNFDRQAQDHGMTRAQWAVLAHLKWNDGVKQTTLAESLDIKPITLARHVDRLEQEGWIERRSDPDDRRAKRLFLTPKATPQLKQMRKLADKVRSRTLAGIDAEEEAQLLEILRRMRDNLSTTATSDTVSADDTNK